MSCSGSIGLLWCPGKPDDESQEVVSRNLVEKTYIDIRDIYFLERDISRDNILVLLVEPAEADYVVRIFLDGELGSSERGKHIIAVLIKYGKGLHGLFSPRLFILLYFSTAKLTFFVVGVLVMKKSL